MNRISITGHLGKNPIIKNFDKDTKVANFSLSYNDRYTKDGEKPLWFNVEGWNGLSVAIMRNLTKGDKVIVSGTFKMKYDKNDKGYPTIILTEPVEYVNVKNFEQGKNAANQTIDQQPSVQQPSVQHQPTQQQADQFSGFTSYDGDAPLFNSSSLY
ncbi:MAG: single-stranded DNA-binding protein [Clostridiales bacterium]|nr:single-stranded DNA-binding protein [Clostridiales bacterium]